MNLILKLKKLIVGSENRTKRKLKKNGVVFGENFHCYTKKIDLHYGYLINIGNNVTISDARILAHDASTKGFLGYSKIGKVKIGNNVFVGADAIILPNVTIGDNVIIGAGSVISKDVPSNSVCIGVPFKVISTYDEYVQKCKAQFEKSIKYNTYNKSEREREKIKLELNEGEFGYNV